MVQSWTQFSYLSGSCMTPYYSTKTAEATVHRRQNHKSNDDSNSLEHPKKLTQLQREKKREKREKKNKQTNKQESKNRAIKTIDKPMSEN